MTLVNLQIAKATLCEFSNFKDACENAMEAPDLYKNTNLANSPTSKRSRLMTLDRDQSREDKQVLTRLQIDAINPLLLLFQIII